jgi:hypothetical protein
MRRAASCAMVMLLTATVLWGGCLSCPQYFTSAVSQAGHCCKPSGGCKKPQNSSAPKHCTIQSYSLAQTVVTPDHAANLLASVVVPSACRLVLVPPPTHAMVDVPIAGDRGSRPGLFLLYSVFRI